MTLRCQKNMYGGLSIFIIEKIVKNEIHQDYLIFFRRFSWTHCKYRYSDTEISWIQSLIVIFWMMIGAPISKQIIPKIGYRWTLWIGGFLMMIGAVLSSMVTSIYYLYGTMGVIFGMGVGLCYLPHLLVAGEYFNEQRNNAFAIISSGEFSTYLWKRKNNILSGNTIANLILVKLIDFLINEFGLRYGLMTFG